MKEWQVPVKQYQDVVVSPLPDPFLPSSSSSLHIITPCTLPSFRNSWIFPSIRDNPTPDTHPPSPVLLPLVALPQLPQPMQGVGQFKLEGWAEWADLWALVFIQWSQTWRQQPFLQSLKKSPSMGTLMFHNPPFHFSSVGKSCRQAKQASCSLCPHPFPSLPTSSAIFEDRDLEVFVLATFLYISHEGDRFCLAAKGYHSWKYWGRRTSGQWCYWGRR